MVQEALTNIVKHSRAEHAEVAMRVRDRVVALDVRDDGVGFDPASVDALGALAHYGLMGMRQRVQMVGGSWEILPNPGGGTWVRITVPLMGNRLPETGAGSDLGDWSVASAGIMPPVG